MNPVISVIVITYNSEPFILDTLESIKKQTYPTIELIISDDFSTDNTVTICKEWINNNAVRFTNCKLVPAYENKGVPLNCNKGIEKSTGEWIKIIAGDDILREDCIEINYKASTEIKADLFYSKMLFFNTHKEFENTGKTIGFFNTLNKKEKYHFYCRYSFFINAPSWFIKRSLINTLNGFDENYRLLEDQVFFLKLLSANHTIYFIDELTVNYRVHNNSVVQKANPLFLQDLKKCFKEIRALGLKKYSLKDHLYRFDALISFKVRENPNNFFLKIIYHLSPARFFKIFIEKKINSPFNLFIKKIIG